MHRPGPFAASDATNIAVSVNRGISMLKFASSLRFAEKGVAGRWGLVSFSTCGHAGGTAELRTSLKRIPSTRIAGLAWDRRRRHGEMASKLPAGR